MEWINNFDCKNKIVFWDIGGNIGLYSIYAALRYSNIVIFTFEPSTSNLRVLSRNISLNQLDNKITICQFPLTDKNNSFLLMKENSFEEGGSMNSYGENYDYNGNIFTSNHQYKIYGTSMNYLLDNNYFCYLITLLSQSKYLGNYFDAGACPLKIEIFIL